MEWDDNVCTSVGFQVLDDQPVDAQLYKLRSEMEERMGKQTSSSVAPPLTRRVASSHSLLYRDPASMAGSRPKLRLSFFPGTLIAMAGS